LNHISLGQVLEGKKIPEGLERIIKGCFGDLEFLEAELKRQMNVSVALDIVVLQKD